MLTRHFITTGLGAGLAIAAGSGLRALAGDKFRWAMSSHMFTPLKPHPEMGIKMAARFGFHGIEPWGNELQNYLNQPPDVFKKLLDEANIRCYANEITAAGSASISIMPTCYRAPRSSRTWLRTENISSTPCTQASGASRPHVTTRSQ